MKKFLRPLVIILLIIIGIFFYITKNPSIPLSTELLDTVWVSVKQDTLSTGTEVDLTNCISYYNGCNVCMVSGGVVNWCTKMACPTFEEPKCLEYAATGVDLLSGAQTITGDNSIPTVPANMTAFSDPELRIAFYYPNTWWTPIKQYETWNQSTYGITLSNGTPNTLFLAAYNGNPIAPRWAYWWDAALHINSSTFISNFCADKTACSWLMNSNGVPYIKWYFEQGEMGSDQTTTILLYYLFNPNSSFRGVIVSNERMLNEPEANFDALVNSIQFN